MRDVSQSATKHVYSKKSQSILDKFFQMTVTCTGQRVDLSKTGRLYELRKYHNYFYNQEIYLNNS